MTWPIRNFSKLRFVNKFSGIAVAACCAIPLIFNGSTADARANSKCNPKHSSSTMPIHKDGHFRANSIIENKCIVFLVDTGASVLMLDYNDAISIGIKVKTLKFKTPMITASGRTHVAKYTIPNLRIGDVQVRNLPAAIAKPGTLHANLLGMSFIGQIKEAVIRRDRMIFRK